MKTSSIITAGSILLLLISGCQQTGAPSQEVGHGSGSGQSATQKAPDVQPPSEAADVNDKQATADEPDDPGMTTERDKTRRQEKPSGDESSQAAPNEGDAEPPQ
ncbi:MAG TPA: hypothetical protein VNH11_31080 [Pirellulales bacterium]|nr:hypothetical protein [Pirellulales bacterium]